MTSMHLAQPAPVVVHSKMLGRHTWLSLGSFLFLRKSMVIHAFHPCHGDTSATEGPLVGKCSRKKPATWTAQKGTPPRVGEIDLPKKSWQAMSRVREKWVCVYNLITGRKNLKKNKAIQLLLNVKSKTTRRKTASCPKDLPSAWLNEHNTAHLTRLVVLCHATAPQSSFVPNGCTRPQMDYPEPTRSCTPFSPCQFPPSVGYLAPSHTQKAGPNSRQCGNDPVTIKVGWFVYSKYLGAREHPLATSFPSAHGDTNTPAVHFFRIPGWNLTQWFGDNQNLEIRLKQNDRLWTTNWQEQGKKMYVSWSSNTPNLPGENSCAMESICCDILLSCSDVMTQMCSIQRLISHVKNVMFSCIGPILDIKRLRLSLRWPMWS